MRFLLLFFFFKQKTAYEMRISDWSSDVCSSDLQLDVGPQAGPAVAPVLLAVADADVDLGVVDMIGLVGRDHPQAHAGMLLGEAVETRQQPQREQEIGRASCRERVCK